MHDIGASDALMDLMFDALDHGIGTVSDFGPEAGAMHPFVMVQDGERREMARLIGADAAGDIERGRAMLRNRGGDRAALVYDGYVPDEGGKSDAILVEAAERGMGHGLLFAQRYAPAVGEGLFRTVGNPQYLGQVDALLPPAASRDDELDPLG